MGMPLGLLYLWNGILFVTCCLHWLELLVAPKHYRIDIDFLACCGRTDPVSRCFCPMSPAHKYPWILGTSWYYCGTSCIMYPKASQWWFSGCPVGWWWRMCYIPAQQRLKNHRVRLFACTSLSMLSATDLNRFRWVLDEALHWNHLSNIRTGYRLRMLITHTVMDATHNVWYPYLINTYDMFACCLMITSWSNSSKPGTWSAFACDPSRCKSSQS